MTRSGSVLICAIALGACAGDDFGSDPSRDGGGASGGASGTSGTGGAAGDGGAQTGGSAGAAGSAGAGAVGGLPVTTDLLLWLRADTLPSGPVAVWEDASDNGKDATQSKDGSLPAVGSRTLGGLRVVDFDGVDDFLQMPTGFGELANGVTLLVVAQADDADTDLGVDSEVIIELANSGLEPVGFSRYLSTADACFVTDEQSPNGFLGMQTQSLKPGAPALLTGTQGPDLGSGFAETSVYFQGALQATRTDRIKAVSTTRTTNYLGKTPTQAQHFKGFIAEVVLYNRVLTTNELNAMHAYLRGKWSCCGE